MADRKGQSLHYRPSGAGNKDTEVRIRDGAQPERDPARPVEQARYPPIQLNQPRRRGSTGSLVEASETVLLLQVSCLLDRG